MYEMHLAVRGTLSNKIISKREGGNRPPMEITGKCELNSISVYMLNEDRRCVQHEVPADGSMTYNSVDEAVQSIESMLCKGDSLLDPLLVRPGITTTFECYGAIEVVTKTSSAIWNIPESFTPKTRQDVEDLLAHIRRLIPVQEHALSTVATPEIPRQRISP